MKITTKCGDDAVQALNETLLVKAAQAKLLRVNKVLLDTTVIGADVAQRLTRDCWPRPSGRSRGR